MPNSETGLKEEVIPPQRVLLANSETGKEEGTLCA